MSAAEARSEPRARLTLVAPVAWLCAAALCGAPAGADPGDPAREAFAKGGGGGYRLSLERHGATTLLRGSADEAAPIAVVCALCTQRELVVAARALGARLAAFATSREPCRLAVGGLPTGAAVTVDGLPGRADGAPMLVEPGPHDVRASIGAATRSRAVALEPGESSRLQWADMEKPPSNRSAVRVAIASSGLGLALAAAGTAFLLLDGDCATPPDAAGHCDELHHLAPFGWSFVGAGAAAVVFGVVYGIAASRGEEAAP